jgi:hypothetical protein
LALDGLRAQQLAALAQLDLTLPVAVTTAITGYQNVMALPPPQVPDRGADQRATRALADELARAALLGGKRPSVPLDVTPIRDSRQADQDGIDRVNLARELRESAAAELCAIFGRNARPVITALQARHREVMGELARHARALPEGADDQAALEAGGQVREHYLAARDLTATITQLRDAMRLTEDRQPDAGADGLELCLMFEKTGRLYRNAWLAPADTSIHGPLGSFEFYLSACREDYEWWVPSAAELAAHATSIREQMHVARVRGADPGRVM